MTTERKGGFFDSLQLNDSITEIDSHIEDVSSIGTDDDIQEESNHSVENDEVTLTDTEASETVETTETIPTLQEDEYSEYGKLLTSLVAKGFVNINDEKEYEDSEDGIQEAINDTIAKRTEEWKTSLNPEAKELFDWVQSGGKVQDFIANTSQVDYSNVDVTDENNQQLLVFDWLKKQDYTEEEAESIVQEYVENGTIDKHANIAHRKLIEVQSKERVKQKESLIQQRQQQEEAERVEFEKFKSDVLSLKEVGGITLTDRDTERLLNHVTKKDADGQTLFSKKDSFKRRMLFAYLDMVDFNVDKLKKEALTQAVVKIRKKVNTPDDTLARRKSTGNGRNSNEDQALNIPDLLDFF